MKLTRHAPIVKGEGWPINGIFTFVGDIPAMTALIPDGIFYLCLYIFVKCSLRRCQYINTAETTFFLVFDRR